MSNSRFEVVRDDLLGESVWIATSRNGLRVRVVPNHDFREVVAAVTFAYGSTDLGFEVDGQRHDSPEGVAHYLEHKLFEDQELAIFDRFAARGARVNAHTGFTRTSYHFGATDQFEENLGDLLRFVGRAQVTKENVDKERGIIEQEIRMYEDSPDFRLFFDFLSCLYSEHPIRHPIGGTVESIQAIDVAELLTCHGAFYRTGNAALAVAGPIDPELVLRLADEAAMPSGKAPSSIRRDDLGPVAKPQNEIQLDVARKKVVLGCKERSLLDDPEARLMRQLSSQMLLDRWFSGSSEIRERLRQSGVIDDSLRIAYMSEASFGFVFVECETNDPERTKAGLREVLFEAPEFDAEWLESLRRKVLGAHVRSAQAMRGLAFGQAEEALEDIRPFRALERLDAVTPEVLRARHAELFADDSFAELLAVPLG